MVHNPSVSPCAILVLMQFPSEVKSSLALCPLSFLHQLRNHCPVPQPNHRLDTLPGPAMGAHVQPEVCEVEWERICWYSFGCRAHVPLGCLSWQVRNTPAHGHLWGFLRLGLLGRWHALLDHSHSLLALMYLLVAQEVRSAGEAFLADGAAVRPLLCVGPQVPMEVIGAREDPFAKVAFHCRLLLSLRALLPGETCAGQARAVHLLLGLGQPGPSPCTGPAGQAAGISAESPTELPPGPDPQFGVDIPPDLGTKGPVFYVDALVKVEVAFVREADLAHGALVGPLFGMAPLVNDEVDLQAEALPTLGAGVRPLAHVATPAVAHQQAAARAPAWLLLAPSLALFAFGAVGENRGGRGCRNLL